jgi:sugar/nucleoside kinase (ribokinase family)
MKKYDVFAVGNALVDLEVEVSEAELKKFGVEKGVMTLIDEERHHTLMDHLNGTRHSRACGGSAANSIIAIAQLGGEAFYSCRVASDEAGDFYLDDLNSHGVDTKQDAHRPDDVTGKCIVMITPDADRSMNTYLGVTGDLGLDSLHHDAIINSEFVYIEGYLVSAPLALEAALAAKKLAKESSVKVAFSLSDPSMVNFFREGIEELLEGGVDLLFCNEDELLQYTRTKTLEEGIAKIKTVATHFAITLGGKGALVWDGEKMLTIKPNRVNVVDTTGAGDMFAGAFIYALCRGYNMQQAGELASLASSHIVKKFGPRLDNSEIEPIRDFLSSYA